MKQLLARTTHYQYSGSGLGNGGPAVSFWCRTILMVDEKKMGRKALCRDGHASDFQTVLLNTAPGDALQRALVKARSQIVVVA